MSNQEELKTELEKIVADLEARVDTANIFLSKEKQRLDTLAGDYRAEIQSLEAKKRDMENEVTKGMASVQTARMQLEADRSTLIVDTQRTNDDLNARQLALDVRDREIIAREGSIQGDIRLAEARMQELKAQVEAAEATIKAANDAEAAAQRQMQEAQDVLSKSAIQIEKARQTNEAAESAQFEATAAATRNATEATRLRLIVEEYNQKVKTLNAEAERIARERTVLENLDLEIQTKQRALVELDKRTLKQLGESETKLGDANRVLSEANAKKAVLENEAERIISNARQTAEKADQQFKLASESIEVVQKLEAEVKAERVSVRAKLDDIERREAELAIAKTLLEKGQSEIASARTVIDEAAKEKAEAALTTAEAMSILRDAKAVREQAKEAEKEIIEKAQREMAEALKVKESAAEETRSAAIQRQEALNMKAEYEKRLTESQAWAGQNSEITAKLTVWEAALRETDRKIDEDRSKLKLAEKEFTAKEKENQNG